MMRSLIALALFFSLTANGQASGLATTPQFGVDDPPTTVRANRGHDGPRVMPIGFRTPTDVRSIHSMKPSDVYRFVVSSDEPPLTTSITVDPPQSDTDKERERLELLQQQLTAKEQELALLRERTAAATTRMQAEKTRAESLEAQLNHKEQELAGLCTQRDTHQQISQELNRTKSSLEQAKQQVSDIERQFAVSNDQLDESTRRLTELDQRLAAKEQDLQQAKSLLADLDKELTARDTQLTQAKQLLASLGRSLPKQALSGKNRTTLTAQATGDLAKVSAKLTSTLQEELKRGAVVLRQDGDKLTLALSSGELFSQGRVTMTAAGTSLVKRIGTALKKFRPQSVEVAGHTDNIPVRVDNRRPFRNNEELSRARAEHASQALIKSGLGPDRVKTVGYADTQPIATNDTEEGRSKNRRVEIIVTQQTEPIASSSEKNETAAGTARPATQRGNVVQKVVNR